MGSSGRRCRVCGATDLRLHREVDAPGRPDGGVFRFNECLACGSVTEETAATYPENPNHPAQDDGLPLSLKFYLEVGASLAFFAETVAFLERVLPAGRRRLLDVGTAFGFPVSMAAQRGWQATGVEPSFMGDFGARMLGIPVIRRFLEDSGLPEASFDAVFSSEVIEHVEDQDGFLRTLDRFLAPDGVLLLTTPNAESLTRSPAEPEWREIMSPGSHVSVLSPKGAELLVRRGGFEDVRLWAMGGDTGRKRIVIAAARRPGVLPAGLSFAGIEADAQNVVAGYLRHLVARKDERGEHDPLYLGALFRAVELAVNQDDGDAGPLIERLDAELRTLGVTEALLDTIRPAHFDDYVNQVPAFAGLFEFHKGMYALNRLVDYRLAVSHFDRAARLLEIEAGLAYYPRAGWPERARKHRTLAIGFARSRRLRRLAERLLPRGSRRRAAAKRLLPG